jgi:DNA repair exonuclease SbcCD ATPase subunit
VLETKLLKFNYVHVKNFCSFIDARLKLDDKGLVLVSGYNRKDRRSNGAGKSTLIAESLSWALFGETIKEIPVAKIPNRFNKNQCSVELGFSLNNHDYVVFRAKRPDLLWYQVDGGEKISLGDSRETTKSIIKILGMGFEEFINSILFGQNIQKYFFLLTDAKQKDMIDHIINIGIIDQYKDSGKLLLDKMDKLHTEKTNTLKEVMAQSERSTSRLVDYKEKEINFLSNQKGLIDIEITQSQQKIQNITKAIEEQQKLIVAVDKEQHLKYKDEELQAVSGLTHIKNLIEKATETLSKKDSLPIEGGVLVLKNPTAVSTKEELLTELKKVEAYLKEISDAIVSVSTTLKMYDSLPIVDGVLVLKQPQETHPLETLQLTVTAINEDILKLRSLVLSNTETIKRYKENLSSVSALHNSDCPICGRLVDDSCVDAVKKSFENSSETLTTNNAILNSTIENNQQQLIVLGQAIEDRNNQVSFKDKLAYEFNLNKYITTKTNIETAIQLIRDAIVDRDNAGLFDSIIKATGEIERCSGIKDLLQQRYDIVKAELSKIDALIEEQSAVILKITALQSQEKSEKEKLLDLISKKETQKENPYKEFIIKEEAFIKDCTLQTTRIQKEIDGVLMLKEGCNYWIKAYGDKMGVKSYIYKKVFPYINTRCNYYLRYLSNGEITASVGLDDKDRFTVDTINTEGADIYKGNSGGERRKIDLAIMFALHDLVASRKYKSNILILDEIFDNLDSVATDAAMALLEDMASNYESIFVISHSDLKEYFDSHVYVVKEGNTSKIVEALEEA